MCCETTNRHSEQHQNKSPRACFYNLVASILILTLAHPLMVTTFTPVLFFKGAKCKNLGENIQNFSGMSELTNQSRMGIEEGGP